MDRSRLTTAEAITDHFGLSAKSYRAALRREEFHWHTVHDRWIASSGSTGQADMLRIAMERTAAKQALLKLE